MVWGLFGRGKLVFICDCSKFVIPAGLPPGQGWELGNQGAMQWHVPL